MEAVKRIDEGRRGDGLAVGLVGREIQELWFRLAGRGWKSLAVVPTPGCGSVLALASGLLQVGRRGNSADNLVLVDATGVGLDNVSALQEEVRARVLGGARVVIALPSVTDCPAAVGLGQAADAGLLCVRRNESTLDGARKTLGLCGQEKFLGSVLITSGAAADAS